MIIRLFCLQNVKSYTDQTASLLWNSHSSSKSSNSVETGYKDTRNFESQLIFQTIETNNEALIPLIIFKLK